jgi:hypothetical protein
VFKIDPGFLVFGHYSIWSKIQVSHNSLTNFTKSVPWMAESIVTCDLKMERKTLQGFLSISRTFRMCPSFVTSR